MPRRRPKDRNKIVIETPLTAPESQAAHVRRKLGVVNPFDPEYKPKKQAAGLSHPTLRI